MDKKKHFGDLDELKAIVRACGGRGSWTEIAERDQFRFEDYRGQIVNWWPHSGTVQVQGLDRETFDRRLARKLRESQGPLRPVPTAQVERVSRDPSLKRPIRHGLSAALVAAAKNDLANKLGRRVDEIRVFVEL